MDQLYSKNKTTIVVVTFLSDSIIDKCIENLGNEYKIIVIENSNRRPKDFHETYDEMMTDEQKNIVLASCNIVDKCISRYGTNQLSDN